MLNGRMCIAERLERPCMLNLQGEFIWWAMALSVRRGQAIGAFGCVENSIMASLSARQLGQRTSYRQRHRESWMRSENDAGEGTFDGGAKSIEGRAVGEALYPRDDLGEICSRIGFAKVSTESTCAVPERLDRQVPHEVIEIAEADLGAIDPARQFDGK